MAAGTRRAPRSFVIMSVVIVGLLSALAGFWFGEMMSQSAGNAAVTTGGTDAPGESPAPETGAAPAADELAGSSWQLTGWSADAFPAADVTITAVFADGNLGGNSGVNSYGGGYTLSGPGMLTIGETVMTMMAGPEPAMQAEATYHELLRQVSGYRLEGSSLTLVDANGGDLLVFTRTQE